MPYSAVTQPRPLPAQERRHAFLDGGRAEHARVAELDEHRAFGVSREATGDSAPGRSSLGTRRLRFEVGSLSARAAAESSPACRASARRRVLLSLNGADACTARSAERFAARRAAPGCPSRKNAGDVGCRADSAQMPSVQTKQHVARLQLVPAAHGHLRDRGSRRRGSTRRSCASGASAFVLGDLALAQQQLDVAVIAGALPGSCRGACGRRGCRRCAPSRPRLPGPGRPRWSRAAACRCDGRCRASPRRRARGSAPVCRKPSGSNTGAGVSAKAFLERRDRDLGGAAPSA